MEAMDPFDAAMVAAESVSQPQHVAAVLILSPPAGAEPGYVDELYRSALASPGPIEPRLRRYAHRGLDTGGVWMWRDDERLDLSRHFRRTTLPKGADMDDFWQLVSEIYAERLDRSRPMWNMHLIDGLPDGRFCFLTKVHHAVMDGVAGFNFIAEALSEDEDRRSMPHIFGARDVDSAATAQKSTGRRGMRSPNPFGAIRSLVNAAASGAALVEKTASGEVSNLVAGLKTDTTVAPMAAPYTRFNGKAGDHRSIAAGSWPKSRFRAIEKRAEVTANDVVLAVIGGVIRDWLLDRDELPDRSLVSLCPVTVRSHHRGPDNNHGNQFGVWLCPLATDTDAAADRLDLVHRSMAEGKARVAERGSAVSMLLLAPVQLTTILSPHLPIPKIRAGYNLPITKVPGPKTEMYWNGAHVEAIYPVAMIYDGLAMTVTVCSYADQLSLTYLAGEDVIPDIADLVDRTEHALADLETAVGLTSPAR
jgi:diacylglycerol O-acyltransferase / wax synthase